MWLLDAKNVLSEHSADRTQMLQKHIALPKKGYAILSHRWEADSEEPKFEEFYFGRPSSTKGISKIYKCCQIAQAYGLDLVWADTCCIDKRSSAELQEGINSMFDYYENATVCFAYLRDVTAKTFDESFTKSEWFLRGWTLQELLAPADLRFYDRDWKLLGSKYELAHDICTATNIQVEVLLGRKRLSDCSVAQRMSWAANRTTVRLEDRAYSLLGIFKVNMAMLYGEGARSFLRLQEEIIKSLDDHSIFAWKGVQTGHPGLLAQSPDAFASCGDIQNIRIRKGRHSLLFNNRGVYGMIPMLPHTLDTYLAVLPCARQGQAKLAQVGIFLRRLYEDDQYGRVLVSGEDVIEDAIAWIVKNGIRGMCIERNISVRQSPLLSDEVEDTYTERIQGFRIAQCLLKTDAEGKALFQISGSWDARTSIVSLPPGSRRIHSVGHIDIERQGRAIEKVRFGFDHDYNPVVFITQRGVLYSEVEDHRGVYMQRFFDHTQDDAYSRQWQSGENFQNALPALGGHWSRVEESEDDIPIAYMSSDVDGFWALKGDRLDGLNIQIVEDRADSKEDTYSAIGQLRLSRIKVEGHLVWYLQLDELASLREPSSKDEQSMPSGTGENRLWRNIAEITGHVDGLSYDLKDT